MILIGQYDSSFTRRIGIALTLYGLPFEHRPWSIFGDADKLRPFNPLLRVPTLVLDDGTVLVEVFAILDHLDRQVPAADRLFPMDGPARTAAMRIAALSSGLADMMVVLFYLIHLQREPSALLVERRTAQIRDTLALLERECAAIPGPYWSGARIGHADIALAATLTHLGAALPEIASLPAFPALSRFTATMEALPVFRAIAQPFIPPA